MEIAIRKHRHNLSYDDAATLDEFWVIAKQFGRSFYHEWKDRWDERGYNEYIVVTEGRLPYCKSPEQYVCRMETRQEILAVNELELVELIERRRCGNGMPNRIYVKQPDSQEIDHLMDKKTGYQTAKKLAPNKINNSNLKNNLSGVSESAQIFGHHRNVFLTEAEVTELQVNFPTIWQEYIERLSEYMASTDKTYKSYVATIRRWAKEDRCKGKGVADYSCKEGESL